MEMEANRACSHVKSTGDTCGAYALRDSKLCYWHHKARMVREERGSMNRRQKAKTTGIVLPLMEDANSVQLAIQMVAQAVADRRITRNEAGMLLYSAQLAILNLKNVELPKAVYSVEMFVVPTGGDEHEDLAPEIVIPKEEDPAFRVNRFDDEEEEDEEEIEEAEKFVSENMSRLKRLGVGTG